MIHRDRDCFLDEGRHAKNNQNNQERKAFLHAAHVAKILLTRLLKIFSLLLILKIWKNETKNIFESSLLSQNWPGICDKAARF